MRTLIKNGRVVTAVDDYHADIFIDGETVTTIGKTYAARLVAGDRPTGLEGLLAARGESLVGLVDDLGHTAPAGVPALDEVARRLAETFERAIGARGSRMRA